MEKKITKKFYYISSLNIVTALLLGKGFTMDSLVLVGVLVVLVLNHTTLVKMVTAMAQSMTLEGIESKRALSKALLLIFLKMLLLVMVMAGVYFYDINLMFKVLILMIFQLIIQVVSIKNNY